MSCSSRSSLGMPSSLPSALASGAGSVSALRDQLSKRAGAFERNCAVAPTGLRVERSPLCVRPRLMYHSYVRRLLQPVAVLLTLVLLQLVLVESGYACRMPADGDASMAGMPMPGSTRHSSSAPTKKGQPQAPCQFPWAPNGCQIMAPCAPAALTVASSTTTAAARVHVAPLRFEPLAPLSLSIAPELPPPRA